MPLLVIWTRPNNCWVGLVIANRIPSDSTSASKGMPISIRAREMAIGIRRFISTKDCTWRGACSSAALILSGGRDASDSTISSNRLRSLSCEEFAGMAQTIGRIPARIGQSAAQSSCRGAPACRLYRSTEFNLRAQSLTVLPGIGKGTLVRESRCPSKFCPPHPHLQNRRV